MMKKKIINVDFSLLGKYATIHIYSLSIALLFHVWPTVILSGISKPFIGVAKVHFTREFFLIDVNFYFRKSLLTFIHLINVFVYP